MAANPACQTFFPRLFPYADGELPPKERMELERHLTACTDCTARVADLRAQSGLIRVGMEMLAEEADFSDFSQKVMSRLTPHQAPLFERLRLSLSERFTYQKGLLLGGFAGAAVAALLVVGVLFRGGLPSAVPDRVAVDAVTTDEAAHVAPVVMKTEQGTIIWLVDHADKVPDSGQALTPADTHKPQGGEL